MYSWLLKRRDQKTKNINYKHRQAMTRLLILSVIALTLFTEVFSYKSQGKFEYIPIIISNVLIGGVDNCIKLCLNSKAII